MRIPPTALLIIAGIVIPNALFLGALAAGLAGEPRIAALCAYALLFALPFPKWSRLVLFPIILIVDTFAVLSGLFGFGVTTLFLNIPYVIDIKAYADPTFAALTALLLVVLLAGIAMILRFNGVFSRGNSSVVLALSLVLIGHDVFAYTGPGSSGSPLLAATPEYGSGVDRSGFRQILNDPQHPHVLFVMAESLGKFTDESQQALVFEKLQQPDIVARYNVTTGTAPFWYSTTAAEMRELCASQENYKDIGPDNDPACLPDMFREAGYDTIAFHGFQSHFFQRQNWYPLVGFQKSVFFDDIQGQLPGRCGNVWRGVCDTELGKHISAMFNQFDKPTFLYWLTLNTHVPVSPGTGTGELNCGKPGARIANAEVCVMTELWRDVTNTVAQVALAHPGIEIFLVGDHRPPLIRRAAREHFSDSEVPWIRLSPKRNGVAPVSANAGGRTAYTTPAAARSTNQVSRP